MLGGGGGGVGSKIWEDHTAPPHGAAIDYIMLITKGISDLFFWNKTG